MLSVRFIDPEGFNRVFQDTPLEVILVNARSNEVPTKAQAIAQFSLAGGGDAEKGRATSPLPYSAMTSVGDDFEEIQRKTDAMLEEQTQLLAQLRKQIATLPAPDPRKPSQNAAQTAQEERRRQLVKILAEIEKRINEENARPKKRYISPPPARRCMPCTTTPCAARWRTRAPSISPNTAARSSMASW